MKRNEVLGALNCTVIDNLPEGALPKFVVILCHGFGAPGNDLVSLADEIFYQDNSQNDGMLAKHVQFIFPEAPISLESQGMPGGRAWWLLDMHKMQMAIQTNTFRDLRNESPDDLPARRAEMIAMIDEICQSRNLSHSQIYLGGFSQGSMLACDVAFHMEPAPAGLTVWSGTLLCEEQWTEAAPTKSGLRVVQSHGRYDPVLPFEAAQWLHELLVDSGLIVNFIPFDNVHTIPAEAVVAMIEELRESILSLKTSSDQT